MTEIKLNRTGKRPLVFVGREVAQATSRKHDSTRWVKVYVYETVRGGYVIGLARLTSWLGESSCYTTEMFTTREGVVEHLEKCAPEIAWVVANRLEVVEVLA